MGFLQCTAQQQLCAWEDTDVKRTNSWGEKNYPVNCLAGTQCHKSLSITFLLRVHTEKNKSQTHSDAK